MILLTTIKLIAQYWDDWFDETLNWYEEEIDVNDILTIQPKEIYLESCNFTNRIRYGTGPLRGLGSHVTTNKGDIITIQSPDEIQQLINNPHDKSNVIDFNNIDDYISKKANNYIKNKPILFVRAVKKAELERNNKIVNNILKIVGIICVVFAIIFPITTYHFVIDFLTVLGRGLQDFMHFWMRDLM